MNVSAEDILQISAHRTRAVRPHLELDLGYKLAKVHSLRDSLQHGDVTQGGRPMLLVIPGLADGRHDLLDVTRQDLRVHVHVIVRQQLRVVQWGQDGIGQVPRKEGVFFWAGVSPYW
eukprot:22150-Eustigmatos_ZCMA.PRE.1